MHKLKEMLMNEIYEYEEKAKKMPEGKISMQDLEKIHKLTDTVKNICKIDMLEDDEYSEATNWMGDGRLYGTSYAGGRGRNAKRDRMGRYSSDMHPMYDDGNSYAGEAKKHLIDKAKEMLNIADSEDERREIHRFIRTLEEA